MVCGNERIHSAGIRYSNMVPVHDISTGRPYTTTWDLLSRNQLSCGMSSFATARNAAMRASDASKS